MKRIAALGVVATLVLGLVGVGTVAATDPGSQANATSSTPVFGGHATNAPQGGSVKVMAKVRHCDRTKALSGSASTTFGATTLERAGKGKSCVLKGRIAVPGSQAIGDYTVTINVTYGGVTQAAMTKTIRVVAAGAP